MIDTRTLDELSERARLLPQENDSLLAAELMCTINFLDDLPAGWKNDRDEGKHRVARLRLEQLFEVQSRRFLGHQPLANKFAMGGLWSPRAKARVEVRDGKLALPSGHDVLLEHVVPTGTLEFTTRELMANGQTPLEIASMIRRAMMHVVLTKGDEKTGQKLALSSTMPGEKNTDHTFAWQHGPKSVDLQLADHFTGRVRQTESDLNRLLWSRYEAAELSGELDFDRTQLTDMSDRIRELLGTVEVDKPYRRNAHKVGPLSCRLVGEDGFEPARKHREKYMAQFQ